ncbi:MAG: VOC family protein [Bacillota bacterium]|nr:VOC family protein [Bacillota bacterium]
MRGKAYSLVHQLGFVVEDIDRAMEDLGREYRVAKWYRPANSTPEEMYYEGKKIDIRSEAVIGYCGKTEIEIISFTGGDENLYSIGLEENGPGFHHVSFFVKDMEAALKEYEALGYRRTQWGVMTGKSTVTRYEYLTKPGQLSRSIIELNETKMGKRAIIRGSRDCAIGVKFGDMELVKEVSL